MCGTGTLLFTDFVALSRRWLRVGQRFDSVGTRFGLLMITIVFDNIESCFLLRLLFSSSLIRFVWFIFLDLFFIVVVPGFFDDLESRERNRVPA